MNSSSQTVFLSSGYTQYLSAYAPFSLTIDPGSIPVSNKVYKISYDFGDGSTHDQLLDLSKGSPLQFPQTHQYFLTGSFVKNIEVNVNVYTFNTNIFNSYKIYLTLNAKKMELSQFSAVSSSGFSELHLVGSRMFGPNDDVLYFFESVEPSYILPVLVNWDEKPKPASKITIPPEYRPFKLLAPFENEAVTSIDYGSHVYSMPDGEGKYLPDTGNVNQINLYDGNSIASQFFAYIDNNWSNLGNWETDGGNACFNFPTTSINVTVFAPIENVSDGIGYARNINFNQNTYLKDSTLVIQESAIFRSNSYNFGNIIGDAYFLNNSYNLGFYPTILALNTQGSDGSTNIIDSSNNNRILTNTGNPYITSYPATPNGLVYDGLAFHLDAEGYSGDGSTWVDSISGIVGTAQNSPTYVADSPSYFYLNGNSQAFNFTRWNSAVNLNNNFSLQAWVNIKGNNEWGGIISLATGGFESGGGEQYSLNTTNGQYFRFDINSGNYLNGPYYPLNDWVHVVTTYESGISKTYINGLLTDTQTLGSTVNTIQNAYISIGCNQFGGFEYMNGQIGLASIYNKVLSPLEVLQNFNAKKTRFEKSAPFGSFLYFDGNSKVQPLTGGTDFGFNTDDFTIEGWICPTRNNGTSQVFYDTRYQYWWDGFYHPLMYLRSGLYLTFNDGYNDVIQGGYIPLNTWNHIAVSRNNKKTKLFLNGKQTGGIANDTRNYKSNANLPLIGGAFDDYNFKGFMEYFKITKGIGKYTTEFTPPTAVLTNDPYTTGTISNTAFFNDNSFNIGTLTNAVFSGNSQNFGTVENAAVWYPSFYPLSGNYTTVNYYGYPSLSAGLIAYWNLDELSGNRIDSTGNGNLITETNGTVIYDSSGVINNAAYITDGNNTSWLSISAGVCDPYNQPKSYSLWFKLDQTNVGYQFLLCQGETSDQQNINPFYLEWDSTLTSIFTTNGFYWTNSINTNIVPTANEWHHVVLTLNGSVAKLYYDGVLVGSSNYSEAIQSTNSQFTLGHYNPYPNGVYGTEKFVGKVDEFGVWNKELSLSEVSFIYNNKVARGLPYPYPYN